MTRDVSEYFKAMIYATSTFQTALLAKLSTLDSQQTATYTATFQDRSMFQFKGTEPISKFMGLYNFVIN